MTNFSRPDIAVVEGIALDHLDQNSDVAGQAVWSITDGIESYPCLVPSADLVMALRGRLLFRHAFQLATWPVNGGAREKPVAVLVAAQSIPDLDDPLRFLPASLCPVKGVVAGTIELIRQIDSTPLRCIVERVFLRRDVTASFWTMPASARHHHAVPGGLALHSLEVAQDLARHGALTECERDLCIAAGLLHDVGKVWSYTPDMFQTKEAQAVGHELLGLSRLHDELAMLGTEWPDGAHAMRALLSGSTRMRQNGSMPSALVARLKAADQRSCERDRHGRDPSGSWVPGAWAGGPAVAQRLQSLGVEDEIF